MDSLAKIKDTFVDYFSPAKRRRTFGGTTTPVRELVGRRWPASECVKQVRTSSVEYRVTKERIPFADVKSFPAGSRKRTRESGEHENNSSKDEYQDIGYADEQPLEDEDQSESIEEQVKNHDVLDSIEYATDHESKSSDVTGRASDYDQSSMVSSLIDPNDSISQISANNVNDTALTEYDDESAISPEDKVRVWNAQQMDLLRVKKNLDRTFVEGIWTEEEKFLMDRLALRSHEPLFPAYWQMDFNTYPPELFSSEKTLIDSNCTSASAGIKALQSLISLGARVKDKATAGLPFEPAMKLEINRYIKWAERDGGYNRLRFIPNIAVITKGPRENYKDVSNNVNGQMKFLAERYQSLFALPKPRINELGELEKYSQKPPIIYGIIIVKSMAFLWTMNSAEDDLKPKFIQHFDFLEPKMEVWNAIAIAIFIVMARNYIMSIKDELEPDEELDDPDA